MLEKVKSLLKAKTAADIEAAIASINLAELREAVDAAQARRTAQLLDGSGADVRTAEKQAAAATLALERGEAALAELERRLAEARAAEAEAALKKRHAEAVQARDAVVQKVRRDYAAAAKTILQVIAADEAAAAQVKSVNDEIFADDRHGLGYIEPASRVLWADVYFGHPDISERTSLLPTPTTPAHGRAAAESLR